MSGTPVASAIVQAPLEGFLIFLLTVAIMIGAFICISSTSKL